MEERNRKYQERVYHRYDACVFRKTKEQFGGLSNMASGFPITVNGIHFYSSEALYQACRFPHLPEVQEKIISQKSPMSAKMVSKPFRKDSRADWESIRIEVMTWCLKVKLAQNFISFGQLLESTFDKSIVEDSSKDDFWGAITDKENPVFLKGVNALGRLLMQLRQLYNSPNRFSLLYVNVPSIVNFSLLGNSIQPIDERINFQNYLNKLWGFNKSGSKIINSSIIAYSHSNDLNNVEEPILDVKKKSKKQPVVKKKNIGVKKSDIQPELPI